MKRLFGWMAGLAGVAALARLLSRRSHASPSPAPAEVDPAQALRQKLDDARTPPAAEPAPEPDTPAQATEGTLDERRARVHAKAQEAIDAMQEPEQPA